MADTVELQPFGAGMETKSWNRSQKCSKNKLFILFLWLVFTTADNQVIQLSLALEVCRAVYVPFSINPCCSVRPGEGGDGGAGPLVGGGPRCARGEGAEKKNPCCFLWKWGHPVQKALSLGAPVRRSWFTFTAAHFVQTLLLVEKNVSSDRIAGGISMCSFLSLAPNTPVPTSKSA